MISVSPKVQFGAKCSITGLSPEDNTKVAGEIAQIVQSQYEKGVTGSSYVIPDSKGGSHFVTGQEGLIVAAILGNLERLIRLDLKATAAEYTTCLNKAISGIIGAEYNLIKLKPLN